MCRMTFVLDFVVANVVGRPAFYKINHTWCTWRYEKKKPQTNSRVYKTHK